MVQPVVGELASADGCQPAACVVAVGQSVGGTSVVVRMRQSAQLVVRMCQQGTLYSSEGMLHFGQPVGMVVSVVVSLGQGRRVLCRMRVCAVRRPVGEAVGGLRRVISSAKVAAHFTDQKYKNSFPAYIQCTSVHG